MTYESIKLKEKFKMNLSSLLCWPVLVPQIVGGLVVPGLDTVNESEMEVENVLQIYV